MFWEKSYLSERVINSLVNFIFNPNISPLARLLFIGLHDFDALRGSSNPLHGICDRSINSSEFSCLRPSITDFKR